MNAKPQLTDVQTLRTRARRHIEEGAVTEGYRGDRTEVLKLLNEALATDWCAFALPPPPLHGARHCVQECRR